ncbi:MAG: lytic transglycosylase domain-containing protein [Lautropia sp.]|nr:lytic transglycosylase domain-containing protein [Lautropia sp.]
MGAWNQARAGHQRYETLSSAVKLALSQAIAAPGDAEPLWSSSRERIEWLTQMSDRLPRRHFPDYEARQRFLSLVRYEAQRAGLEPELVLALIQVESAFRQYAISSVGARGYMQVMPFWTRVLADGDASTLFDPRINIRYGCVILRHYLDLEKGDLFLALGRYNGSRGRAPYPRAVLAARDKWRFEQAAGPHTGR